jgi:predicted SprT family Zn-dependent metalloprotease
MLSKWLHNFISNRIVASKTRSSHSGERDTILEEKARHLLEPYAPNLAARVTILWNRRLRTSAGLARYQSWEVILNPKLQQISEEEVDKTLRHELAHLLAFDRAPGNKIAPHGAEWRQACIDLGIPSECRTHQIPFVRHRQQRRFFYRCPSCSARLRRVRKPRRKIACLACCRKYAGGRYEERFRFILESKEILSLIVKEQDR